MKSADFRNITARSSWSAARLKTGTLHRDPPEFVRDGHKVSIEPRVIDLLTYLIEQRHRVVHKSDLLQACWGDANLSDGLLARAVMKARQAIGDESGEQQLIRTVPRTGYQFVGEVSFEAQLRPATPPPAAAGALQRLVVLPLVNLTGDDALAWVEFGLTAMVAKALHAVPDITVVPVEDGIAAIGPAQMRAHLRTRLAAVDAVLAPQFCAWGELQGTAGWLQLHVGLRDHAGRVEVATFVDGNPAKLAGDMVRQLQQWLTKAGTLPEGSAASLGDPFLDEVFARAMQRSREQRLIEAEHLFEVLRSEPVDDLMVQAEATQVLVTLGRSDAEAALECFEAHARQQGQPQWLALSHAMYATHLELQGQLPRSIEHSLAAVEMARSRGVDDFAVRSQILCARRMAMAADERAAAVVSAAVPAAERLGNRVLLCDAYCTAAQVAGFRNDWVAAMRYQSTAVSISKTLHAAAQSLPYGGLSWIQTSLGQLDAALLSARTAFETARLSGAQPQQGLAAGQAALACLNKGRVRRLAELHGELMGLSQDSSVAMQVARDVYCRSTLLALSGHFEAAHDALQAPLQATQGHSRLRSRCLSWQLTLLLLMQRFGELRALCAELQVRIDPWAEGHLKPQMDRVLAFADLFEHGGRAEALARLVRATEGLPLSEMHARISMEAAWLALEQDQPGVAQRLTAPLSIWMEESPSGLLLSARLQLAQGRAAEAVQTQRRFISDYAEIVIPAHHALLSAYEAHADGRATSLAPISLPLTLLYGLDDTVQRELPAALRP